MMYGFGWQSLIKANQTMICGILLIWSLLVLTIGSFISTWPIAQSHSIIWPSSSSSCSILCERVGGNDRPFGSALGISQCLKIFDWHISKYQKWEILDQWCKRLRMIRSVEWWTWPNDEQFTDLVSNSSSSKSPHGKLRDSPHVTRICKPLCVFNVGDYLP